MTIKTRKKERSLEDMDEASKWKLLKQYTDNPSTPVVTLCEEWNLNQDTFSRFIERFYKSFVQTKETKLLISEQQLEQNQKKCKDDIVYYRKFESPATMNDKFLSLLGEGEECSENEHTYSYTYIFTGNNEKALKESGLDVGLAKDKAHTNTRAILKMRGYYLRSIPRVKSLIEDLRSTKLEDILIDKGMVQSELVDLLYQLKEEGNPTTVNQRLRIIEDLAKTCGAMSENIKIEQVDPSSALDILIMKAKEAEVNSVTQPDLIDIIS